MFTGIFDLLSVGSFADALRAVIDIVSWED